MSLFDSQSYILDQNVELSCDHRNRNTLYFVFAQPVSGIHICTLKQHGICICWQNKHNQITSSRLNTQHSKVFI